jgi:hypothetical protein
MKKLVMIFTLLALGLPTVFLPATLRAANRPSPAVDELAGDTADAQPGSTVPSTPAPAPGATATAPATFFGPIAPDQYYQLLLERQQLSISSYRQIGKILDANPKDQAKVMKELARHEEERQAKSQALFEKYRIGPEDYYRSYVGTEAQAQRSRYLDQHPEVRDQIAANSSELRALEKEVWGRMSSTWNQPAPPPPKKPKKP